MIRSLDDIDPADLAQADALVIGAGIAGLVTARELARKGYRVLVLESGGRSQDDDSHPLNEVVSTGRDYGGVQAGRFRCLGGTSTRWGGALIPFLDADLNEAGWPVTMDDLSPYIGKVEELFGLAPGAYDDPDLLGNAENPDFLARLAKWPTFKRRNVARLLEAEISATGPIDVLLDAHVTGFIRQDGRLAGITLGSSNGTEHRLLAPHVFICAGAIESTRLLLLLDRQLSNRLPHADEITGRYFHDHLSCATGRIAIRQPKAFNRLAGFRFEGETMRNLRFELSPHSPLRQSLPPQFAHIAFVPGEEGGFAVLRDLLRDVQQHKPPSPALLGRFAMNMPWLIRAAWWRAVEKRVLAPNDGEVRLVTVTQQEPLSSNRITLSGDETDSFGIPKAQLHWSWSPGDVARLKESAQAFAECWRSSRFAQLADLNLYGDARIEAELGDAHGIYQPCGSTRMGTSAKDGLVDDHCRVFGVDNLRLFSTSVLPTSGGANPTMMMLLLALRSIGQLPDKR